MPAAGADRSSRAGAERPQPVERRRTPANEQNAASRNSVGSAIQTMLAQRYGQQPARSNAQHVVISAARHAAANVENACRQNNRCPQRQQACGSARMWRQRAGAGAEKICLQVQRMQALSAAAC